MRRCLALFAPLTLLFWNSFAQAQEPHVTITSNQDEVIVGQPFILRVEVLVPTFMPSAPVFPSFEVPGLIVRLPERSTQPVSRQVEGETWAGVTRTYRLYPMQAGVTDIPAQEMTIQYRDPASTDDLAVTVAVPATRIMAGVPEGARTLDPIILAQQVEITQTWEAAEGDLAVGDAVRRRLEIAVEGTSALFVPPLLEGADPLPPETSGDGDDLVATFRSYQQDAQVTETLERGVMSGTRIEEVSYIAQTGGVTSFPPLRLEWYNLDSQSVEEIELEGRQITVKAPMSLDPQTARRFAALSVLAVIVAFGLYRMIWPVVRQQIDRAKTAYAASVHAAHRRARRATRACDLSALIRALDARHVRGHVAAPDLHVAVLALTQAVYRDGASEKDVQRAWDRVRKTLRKDAPSWHAKGRELPDLPPLNPFT